MSAERLALVLAMPEASGRRAVAIYMATDTALDLSGIRKVLAVAPIDAAELARDVLASHRDERFTPESEQAELDDPDAIEAAKILATVPRRRSSRS